MRPTPARNIQGGDGDHGDDVNDNDVHDDNDNDDAYDDDDEVRRKEVLVV